MELKQDYEKLFYPRFAEFVVGFLNDKFESVPTISSIGSMTEEIEGGDNDLIFYWILAGVKELEPELTENSIASRIEEVYQLLITKNNEYGNSIIASPVMAPSLSVAQGILCRLSDKIARYKTLAATGGDITDTIKDFIGYCVWLWIALECDKVEQEDGYKNEVLVSYPSTMPLNEVLSRLKTKDVIIVPR